MNTLPTPYKRPFLLLLVLLAGGVGRLSAQTTQEEIERQTVEVNILLDRIELTNSPTDKEALAGQALQISRNIRYMGGQVRSLMALAEIRRTLNDAEAAMQYYVEAESKLRSAGDEAFFFSIKSSLGDLFFSEKLYANARKNYLEALKVKPDDFPVKGKLADTYLLEMRFDSAEVLYKDIERHYNETGDYGQRVQIYQKLAEAYNSVGNQVKGLYYYLLIENILEQFGTPLEKAILYNNLGRQYTQMEDYKNALENFKKAEIQCEFANCPQLDVLYTNIGIAQHNTGNTIAGINSLQEARKILTGQKNYARVADLEQMMAEMYFRNNDLYNARQHNSTAIRLSEQYSQTLILLRAYETAADLHQELYEYEKAIDYYEKYLKLNDSVRLAEQARQQRLIQQQAILAETEGAVKLLLAEQNVRELELKQVNYEKEQAQSERDRLELQNREKELTLLQKQKEVDRAQLNEQILLALKARQELRLRELDAERQGRLIRDLRMQEETERAQRMADSTRRAQEVEILRKDNELNEVRISQQESLQSFLMGLGVLLMLILALLGAGWWFARQAGKRLRAQNRQIQAQNDQIAEERHKSDRLLRNILPDEIAHELKTRGYASPRFYDTATVVFTDFTNFTKLSEQLTPKQLIDELDECFLAFDEICEAHNLEKIKTIGDAFMCAGGLPIPNESHATDAVRAALEMVAWLDHRARTNPKAIFNAMRIGIHTGPVVAGVVGKNKFAYDIWGDAVNLASRLEELGEPGRINVSGSTYEAIKHRYRCSYRGKHEVHNKGLVDMYFVEGS
ncbi:MAG: adenylate/guanylate cyclase domain-containing protein [Saprospiraceae bacterium]|nr:adenylate/guanylate cyclase domain-containing protein [Saprospiraceae bacterium]